MGFRRNTVNVVRVFGAILCAACLQAQTPVEKAWTILSAAAQDKSYETRGRAIRALGVIAGDPRAQTAAEAALKDGREEVRVAAADALGEMRALGSVPKLKAALRDPATSVVFASANALFVMGDPSAYQFFYAVLTGERKSGDALVASQMKMLKDPKALSAIGFEAGIGFIPFGGVSYSVFKMATKDSVSPVRAAAAVRLINDPDPKTAQALEATIKDEKWLVRAAVVNAIARRNDPSLLKAVIPLLDDKEDVVRFNACAAVIHLNSQASIKAKPKGKR
jgi:HEAT repeat protein